MIIGMGGFKGSGKDTAADLLVKNHKFKRIAFADHLKDIAALMFDWPRDLLQGDTEESRKWREIPDKWWSEEFGKDFSPRLALQLLGTEAVRNVFHPSFWVIYLKRTIESNPKQNYVITDARFPNEIEFIQNDLNGFYVRVVRGKDPEWVEDAIHILKDNKSPSGKELIEMGHKDCHYSEWAALYDLSKVDYLVDNNGNLDALEANLSVMVRKFYGP